MTKLLPLVLLCSGCVNINLPETPQTAPDQRKPLLAKFNQQTAPRPKSATPQPVIRFEWTAAPPHITQPVYDVLTSTDLLSWEYIATNLTETNLSLPATDTMRVFQVQWRESWFAVPTFN